jgi:adenylosuccinate synthase
MGAGCGVPSKMVERFIGVIKAYTTRVGAGPFPTELDNEIGQTIRERGHEYGTTTGRPRRCGWFDGIVVKYSALIGGINELAMMHLDTISGFDELKVCRAYSIDGEETDFFPSDANELAKAVPVYESLPGWKEDISKVNTYDELPQNAKKYIELVEKITKVPVTMIGKGPKRSDIIYKQ